MSKFNNDNFRYNNTILTYQNRFVARFRNGGVVAFKQFLRENFEVEVYFNLLEGYKVAPIRILETKGYVSPIVCKQLRKAGYPTTQEGLQAYIDSKIERSAA
jgi:hypothetical protein|tara:strand:+ start:182 stop:487 length:306 start_codon:yes stop_codon:yes gene_type:complete